MNDTQLYNPKPELKCLRWHTCTAGNPWTEETGRRVIHPDAENLGDGVMYCPHCHVSFPEG